MYALVVVRVENDKYIFVLVIINQIFIMSLSVSCLSLNVNHAIISLLPNRTERLKPTVSYGWMIMASSYTGRANPW